MAKDASGAPQQSAPETWQPVTYERVAWELDGSRVSRTQLRRHSGPYEAAVPARVARLDLRVSSVALAEVEEAGRAVARFDEYISQAFGNASGEIAPMSAILLRTESASSSQIENLTAGARQIAMAEIGEHSSRNAKVVTGNVRAMEAAVKLADHIDKSTILEMHRELLEESQPNHAGRWRDVQVWIGGSNMGPHAADFIPPLPTKVVECLDDLLEFIERDDLPVMAQVAAAHAQFETIHPFEDGNGRTGRALVHAMLASKGLTQRTTVPVSAGLLVDTESYFDALGQYRLGSVEPIVRRFAEATIYAVGSGRDLVDDLRRVRSEFNDEIRARRDAVVWRIADLLIAQPVINNAFVSTRLSVSVVAAQRAIDQLEAAGVISRADKGGRRNRVWQCRRVLDVLDDFGASIRRSPR